MNRKGLCSHCGFRLPKGRKLKLCTDCNRVYMRQWYAKKIKQQREPELPGVDIDRIHYLRGAIADPQPRKKRVA